MRPRLVLCLGIQLQKAEKEAREIKGNIDMLRLSARTGEGLEEWFAWLEKNLLEKTGT